MDAARIVHEGLFLLVHSKSRWNVLDVWNVLSTKGELMDSVSKEED